MNSTILKFLAVSLCIIATANIFAQDIKYKKNFGGQGWDIYNFVIKTSDGFVTVGYSGPDSFESGDWEEVMGKGNNDAIIVKYGNAGNIVWKKNFGGSGWDEYSSVTEVTGGFVAVGRSFPSSFENGDWTGIFGKGDDDAIIVKYDNDGNVVWKKNFGGNGSDKFYSVTATTDGIIAVGNSMFGSFGSGDWVEIEGKGNVNAIIVKYDNDGNVVWKKNFGGNGSDLFYSVTTVDDGVVVVGTSGCSTINDCSFGNGDWEGIEGKGTGDSDAILVKFDNDGNIVWKKNFGGNSADCFYCVTTLKDGIVAVGNSGRNSFGNGDWEGIVGKGNNDAIIVKYDNSGNVVWKKHFGGESADIFYSVTQVSDDIVAVGYSYCYDCSECSFGNGDWEGVQEYGLYSSDAIIVKYDNSGNVVWKKHFGGSDNDIYYSVTAISDGIVAVGASWIDSFGNGEWVDVTGKGSGDAIIVIYSNQVGIFEPINLSYKIKVYPNPTLDKLRVETLYPVPLYDIAIFDVMGRNISVKKQISLENSGNEMEIDISYLSTGIYFLRVEREVIKIVKQ